MNNVFNVYCVVFSSDFQRLTLDRNTTQRDLTLSEDNRTATRVDGQEHQYPDHPERFDVWPQVLTTESESEHCYSEIEVSGDVEIAGTDRRISRKGDGADCRLGANALSWRLWCDGDSYYVTDNWTRVTVTRIESDSSHGFDDS